MDKVTICTSWDGNGVYTADFVNRLHSSCLRNTTYDFDFVLFAGAGVEGKQSLLNKEIKIVQTGLNYWWQGMLFWMKRPPRVKTATKLFLDLDLVITGSLDVLLNWPSDYCYSRDWHGDNIPAGGETDANPGVTLIRNGEGSYVWEEYVRAGMPNWNHIIDKKRGSLPMAAQGIINEKKKEHPFDLFPANLCTSYKLKAKNGLPPESVTVHFHGRPKQNEVNDEWVKENWR